MTRKTLIDEDGNEVLLPGSKRKLCGCGNPSTRHCDFPLYDRDAKPGDKVVRCSKPLCDDCAVPGQKSQDFCKKHADYFAELLQQDFEDEETG